MSTSLVRGTDASEISAHVSIVSLNILEEEPTAAPAIDEIATFCIRATVGLYFQYTVR